MKKKMANQLITAIRGALDLEYLLVALADADEHIHREISFLTPWGHWLQDEIEQSLAELPVFGGATPSDTDSIWSWDETRLLVGDCPDDFEIVTRAEWEL